MITTKNFLTEFIGSASTASKQDEPTSTPTQRKENGPDLLGM